MSHKKNFRLTRRSLALKRASEDFCKNGISGRHPIRVDVPRDVFTCYLESLTATLWKLSDWIEETFGIDGRDTRAGRRRHGR